MENFVNYKFDFRSHTHAGWGNDCASSDKKSFIVLRPAVMEL